VLLFIFPTLFHSISIVLSTFMALIIFTVLSIFMALIISKFLSIFMIILIIIFMVQIIFTKSYFPLSWVMVVRPTFQGY